VTSTANRLEKEMNFKTKGSQHSRQRGGRKKFTEKNIVGQELTMESSGPKIKEQIEATLAMRKVTKELRKNIRASKIAEMQKPPCDERDGSQRETVNRSMIEEELRAIFGESCFRVSSPVHSRWHDFGVKSPAGDGGMSKIPTLAKCKVTNKKEGVKSPAGGESMSEIPTLAKCIVTNKEEAKLKKVSCDTDDGSQAASRSTSETEELVSAVFGDDDFDVQSKPEEDFGVESPGENKEKSQVLSRPVQSGANPECVVPPADVSKVNVISDDENAQLLVKRRMLAKLLDSSSRTALNAGKSPKKLFSSPLPLALNSSSSSRGTSLQPDSREQTDIFSNSSSDVDIWLSSEEETAEGNEIHFFGQSLSYFFVISFFVFFFMSS